MSRRIRTLKPEWLESESLGSCSDSARVLSAALILLADDFGNGRGAPGYLAGQVWPYRNPVEARETLESASRELLSTGFVRFYRVSGQTFFHLPGWDRHQRVDKPSKTYANPTPKDEYFLQPDLVFARPSRDPREPPPEASRDPRGGLEWIGSGSGVSEEEEARARPSTGSPPPEQRFVGFGRFVERLWSTYEQLSAEHGLPAKPRVPGDEQPLRQLFEADWKPEDVELALAALAQRAAAHETERAFWDGKRCWSPEVLREGLARVSGNAPGRGVALVPRGTARPDPVINLLARAAELEAAGK